MATSKGLALVFGTKATVKVYDSANVLPLVAGIATLESMDITHECDTEQVKNSSGEVVANVSSGDRLSATFNIIPSGATTGDAKLAALIPNGNGRVNVTVADSISIGAAFTAGPPITVSDSINGDWIYIGGGSLKFTQSGKAMLSLPCVKYAGITGSTAAITL
jgi:hypothetical protein